MTTKITFTTNHDVAWLTKQKRTGKKKKKKIKQINEEILKKTNGTTIIGKTQERDQLVP